MSGSENLNQDTHWVLCDEVQKCIWTDDDSIPEVDISFAVQLATFETESRAIAAAESQLAGMGANPTYADVRPIEECACCSADFLTGEYHHVLTVSEEVGEEDNPTILQCYYVARICSSCALVSKINNVFA